jgi:Flp pilus assembly pilin Flp
MSMKYFQAVKERVAGFLLDEEAASAIEYAVVAGVIVAILLGAMQVFFGTLETTFESIAQGIAEIVDGS